MDGIYQEFENENALRAYPFAAGCSPRIDAGVFVDAALYPVNPEGTVYLSGVSEDGVLEVSDDTGVVMAGTASGNTVEFHDMSTARRRSGTLVASSEKALADFAGSGARISFAKDEAAFAAGCVFPVALAGVTSLSVGGAGVATEEAAFLNGGSDDVRVSCGKTEDGLDTLRFDALPRPSARDDSSIRRIICVVDGATPFRIQKPYSRDNPDSYWYNTVVLSLEGIDRDAVCASAHREDSLEMADTCACENPELPRLDELPETFQTEEVFIPPDPYGTEGGIPEGAANAFFLVVPNEIGYSNPLSITLEDGAVAPKTDDLEVVLDGLSADLAEGEMLDKVTSKGVKIQVPGLGGGAQ